MSGIKRYFLRITFALFTVAFSTSSCSDNFESSIPYVPVNFSINLINYNDLTVAGNSVAFGSGYGGIIVLFNGIQYFAYDASCPYEASQTCLITVEGGIGTCSCCGSQYNLWDGGFVMSGTSTEPLLQYQATASGNRLYISN